MTNKELSHVEGKHCNSSFSTLQLVSGDASETWYCILDHKLASYHMLKWIALSISNTAPLHGLLFSWMNLLRSTTTINWSSVSAKSWWGTNRRLHVLVFTQGEEVRRVPSYWHTGLWITKLFIIRRLRPSLVVDSTCCLPCCAGGCGIKAREASRLNKLVRRASTAVGCNWTIWT